MFRVIWGLGINISFVRLFARCVICNNAALKMILTDGGDELWILNESESVVEIGPAELCGFNLGSLTEKIAGQRSFIQ